ncbi:VOC family protein [Serinicoccus kebangsaanensis]|uniref:VOC family protein n=1 Tax=Serinicoccus kebangsaanensis TaxID=2602069 RepID=UPI00124E8F19|nr:VOC family protein [Serinicoccus kebangsaanensis]
MSTLNPYVSFDGSAKAAMERYQQIFGGDLALNTFGEYGMEGEGSDGVMHAQLTTPAGFTLMASDTPPGMPAASSEGNMSISLSGDDEAELRGYWDGLADGGQVTMPLEPQMWGDTYGQLTDQFGVSWMVNIAGPQAS